VGEEGGKGGGGGGFGKEWTPNNLGCEGGKGVWGGGSSRGAAQNPSHHPTNHPHRQGQTNQHPPPRAPLLALVTPAEKRVPVCKPPPPFPLPRGVDANLGGKNRGESVGGFLGGGM